MFSAKEARERMMSNAKPVTLEDAEQLICNAIAEDKYSCTIQCSLVALELDVTKKTIEKLKDLDYNVKVIKSSLYNSAVIEIRWDEK